jgi:serine/threonine protein kinase
MVRLAHARFYAKLCQLAHSSHPVIQANAVAILHNFALNVQEAVIEIFSQGQTDLLIGCGVMSPSSLTRVLSMVNALPDDWHFPTDCFITDAAIEAFIDILFTETADYPCRHAAALILSQFIADNAELRQEVLLRRGIAIFALFLKFRVPVPPFHHEIDPSELVIIRPVGSGATSQVLQASYKGQQVAVKRFHAAAADSVDDKFQEELLTTSLLRHPVLVSAIGAVTKTPGQLMLVTEFYSNGDLSQLLQRPDYCYNVAWALQLAIDLANGLSYLHAAGMMHRDMKLENILLSDQWRAGITDFGTSRSIVGHRARMTVIGTPAYMAPEMLLAGGNQSHQELHTHYNEFVDVYAFGILFWEVIFFRQYGRAFSDLNLFAVAPAVLAGRRPPCDFDSRHPLGGFYSVTDQAITSSFIDLIQSSWAADPALRLSFSALLTKLYQLKEVYGVNLDVIPPPLSSSPLKLDDQLPEQPEQLAATADAPPDAVSIKKLQLQRCDSLPLRTIESIRESERVQRLHQAHASFLYPHQSPLQLFHLMNRPTATRRSLPPERSDVRWHSTGAPLFPQLTTGDSPALIEYYLLLRISLFDC